jgi:hypothetical protein
MMKLWAYTIEAIGGTGRQVSTTGTIFCELPDTLNVAMKESVEEIASANDCPYAITRIEIKAKQQ